MDHDQVGELISLGNRKEEEDPGPQKLTARASDSLTNSYREMVILWVNSHKAGDTGMC